MENSINLLNNLRLLGHKAIQVGNGEVIARKPNDELVMFKKSSEIIATGFKSTYIIAKGVCVIMYDEHVSISNEKYGNVDINNTGFFSYLGDYYICSSTYTTNISIYNIKGEPLLLLDNAIVIDECVNKGNVGILMRMAGNHTNYTLVIIDKATDKCMEYKLELDINVKSIRYLSNTTLLISNKECMYTYEVCTKKVKEFGNLSFTEPSLISELIPDYYCNNSNTVLHSQDNNKYYLMDATESVTLIDTDMKPLLYYNKYYLAKSENKMYVLDSDFNAITKGYADITFISEHKIIAMDDGHVTILNLQTMNEKHVVDDAVSITLYSVQDEIHIALADGEDLFVSLKGDILYTLEERGEVMGDYYGI